MKNIRKSSIFITLIVIAAFTTFAFYNNKNREFEIVKSLDIYHTLFRELNLFYVDEIDPEKILKSSIEGMLETLDPYTQFIPESDLEDFRFQTTGEYGGIGALIRKKDEYAIIAEPYENFPAHKSGLKAGDLILSVDGVSTKGKSISEVSEMLKGIPNTEAKVLIERPVLDKKITITVLREKITIPNVPYYGMVTDKIGYIRLSNFTSNAGKEVEGALKDLKEESGAEAIILDVRGNPGGLLMESVNVAGLFVDKGQEIVSTKGKVKQFDQTYRTTRSQQDTEIPIAVLVSRSSASASEIVAGSIQDLDRGVVIGQRTFGKGLVQTTRPLSYNNQLKVTTAKYYTPSGRCIQALDYTHRNEDGSVGHIPDSLISEFKTINGRKVYDGGGIEPDISVEARRLSQITISLFTKQFIFDYATHFAAHNETIGQLSDFKLSESQYLDFMDFIKGKDFDYQTESETLFEELIETAKKEKYFDIAANEFDALKLKLAHDKEKDLQTFSEEIKSLLEEEIITRYYYQKGRIKLALREDEEIKKAIEVLEDAESYHAILRPSAEEGKKVTALKPVDK